MFTLIKRLRPKLILFRDNTSSLVSMRHFLVKFDYVSKSDGTKFIQYGESPVKWIMYKKKKAKWPTFISSVGWTIKGMRFGITFGTSRRPLKFDKQWGAKYAGTLLNKRSGERIEPVVRLDSR